MPGKRKPENEKYTITFTFQMTKKQRKEIDERAKREQMPIAVYIRRILFPMKAED